MAKQKLKMPKEGDKAIHPNSRKAKQLSKIVHRDLRMKKKKNASNKKLNNFSRKLMWFKDNLKSDDKVFTPQQLHDIIELYINRFDKEVEETTIKNNIGKRMTQTSSRINQITALTSQDKENFITSGFEIVDLLDPEIFEKFQSWTGETKFLSGLRLRKFNKDDLLSNNVNNPSFVDLEKDANEEEEEGNSDVEME